MREIEGEGGRRPRRQVWNATQRGGLMKAIPKRSRVSLAPRSVLALALPLSQVKTNRGLLMALSLSLRFSLSLRRALLRVQDLDPRLHPQERGQALRAHLRQDGRARPRRAPRREPHLPERQHHVPQVAAPEALLPDRGRLPRDVQAGGRGQVAEAGRRDGQQHRQPHGESVG